MYIQTLLNLSKYYNNYYTDRNEVEIYWIVFWIIAIIIAGIIVVIRVNKKEKQEAIDKEISTRESLADSVVSTMNEEILNDDEQLYMADIINLDMFANFYAGESVQMVLHNKYLSIQNKNSEAKLNYDKIKSFDFGTKQEVEERNVSIVENIIAGAALAGTDGAIIGAISASNGTRKKVVDKEYMLINYISKNNELKTMRFETLNSSACDLAFILSRILENNNNDKEISVIEL